MVGIVMQHSTLTAHRVVKRPLEGREDAKDEPGAADFYYGECEMRRHDPDAPRAERLVLWVYWLRSGYALRAWRALATLAVVVVVVLAGMVLALWGSRPQRRASVRPPWTAAARWCTSNSPLIRRRG